MRTQLITAALKAIGRADNGCTHCQTTCLKVFSRESEISLISLYTVAENEGLLEGFYGLDRAFEKIDSVPFDRETAL